MQINSAVNPGAEKNWFTAWPWERSNRTKPAEVDRAAHHKADKVQSQ